MNRAGHDKYGHFVMFGDFRSAMPDAKTAKESAAASELLAACKAAASLLRKLGGTNHDPEYSDLLAAIDKAKEE